MFDWLFPKKCFNCQKSGNYLCSSCKERIVSLKTQVCPVCQRVSFQGKTHPGCKTKEFLDGLVSLYHYRRPLKGMIKSFKYYQLKDLRETIANLAINVLKEKKILFYWQKNNFIFTPLPLFPARKLWRGFNQSEVILKEVCLKLNLPFNNDLIIRKKWTKDQAGLKSKERKENVQGAFEINKKEAVKNKNMVIFDDVWTTGNSLKECARTLKNNDANIVWGLTLCRN